MATEVLPEADTQSESAEFLRIDFSGTIWFAATLIGAGITLAGLLSGGWRPADLPADAGIAWWLGGALAVLGIALLAYSGCPVKGPNLHFDLRTKSLAIRTGLALYGIGGVIALVAVLSTPAG